MNLHLDDVNEMGMLVKSQWICIVVAKRFIVAKKLTPKENT